MIEATITVVCERCHEPQRAEFIERGVCRDRADCDRRRRAHALVKLSDALPPAPLVPPTRGEEQRVAAAARLRDRRAAEAAGEAARERRERLQAQGRINAAPVKDHDWSAYRVEQPAAPPAPAPVEPSPQVLPPGRELPSRALLRSQLEWEAKRATRQAEREARRVSRRASRELATFGPTREG